MASETTATAPSYTQRTNVRLIAALSFAAGVIVALMAAHFFNARNAHPSLASNQNLSIPGTTSPAKTDPSPKPWGHLLAQKIPLADPDTFFPDRQARLQPARWQFTGYDRARIEALAARCGLSPEQQQQFLDPARQTLTSNAIVLTPPAQLVLTLTPESRQQIYSILREFPENYPQQYPFRFALNGFAERFSESDASPEALRTVSRLIYTNQHTLCLADLQVLATALEPAQFTNIVETLYRWPAYRLRLNIEPDSDLETIIHYWSRAGNEKRIRPLIESMAKVKANEDASINISYLLPPFARLRLYTFPDAWKEAQASREDCFWTSMNFFNDTPDMRYLDPPYVKSALQSNFEPIREHPMFGDLLTILSEKGDGVHMCVYLADNYVYTKNGINTLAPWMIMKIPDMLLGFASDRPERIVFFRRKGL